MAVTSDSRSHMFTSANKFLSSDGVGSRETVNVTEEVEF